MGMLLPVFVAVVLNGMGFLVFREPKEVGPGPLMSSYIFMAACFFLLWDVRLYPRSMRKLSYVPQMFMEYLIAQFLIEHMVIDFWFPLEAGAIGFLPKIADALDEMVSQGGWTCETLCETLKSEKAGYILSYALSTFFLLSVLHASRAIDLRELKSGPMPFFEDILNRLKTNYRRVLRQSGLNKYLMPKKKLTFSDSKKHRVCHGNSNNNPANNDPCAGILTSTKRGRYTGSASNTGSKSPKSGSKKRYCNDSSAYPPPSYHHGGDDITVSNKEDFGRKDRYRKYCNLDGDASSVTTISDDFDACSDALR